jgi:hypothetical protein
MKYINTNKLDDTQYEFLSNLVIDLAIEKDGVKTEFEVEQLKEDEDGVVYAPTEIYEYVDLSSKPANYEFEMFQTLKGYTPLATILKERKGTLA